MRIITHTCPDCGTVIAANVLESEQVTSCPRYDCKAILRFTDLSADEQAFVREHSDRYQMD